MTREQAIKALQKLEHEDPANARVDADLSMVIDFLKTMTAKARPSKYQRRKPGPNAPGAGRPPGEPKRRATFKLTLPTWDALHQEVERYQLSEFVERAINRQLKRRMRSKDSVNER
jgi:hypothetical protein